MKRIVSGLVLLILSLHVCAQYKPEPYYGFRLGLTAHPTIGWIKPEDGKGNGVNVGFSYGLVGDFNFAENYSFSTGLTVTTINGKSTEINVSPYHDVVSSTTPIPYELKYKLQYVEIPLTVKLKTTKIGELRWYGQFGLSNGFNIGAKQDAQSQGRGLRDDENIYKYTNLYRAGLIIGGGLEYDVADNTSVMAGLTFNNGFTDISDDKNRNVRNHYVGITFGVLF
jgi:long-subunit fatty acid transport protein